MNKNAKHSAREFFGFMMRILKERGFERDIRKKMIRDSGLIEECKTESGVSYVLHYNVDEWCDYVVNPYAWGYKRLRYDKRASTYADYTSKKTANVL